MTYQSFTLLCNFLCDSISNSFCGLTGRLLKTRQFQVAVGVYYMACCGNWGQLADVAGIGESTAKMYTQPFCNAVFMLLKPSWLGAAILAWR